MLKIDRANRELSRLKEIGFVDAEILERADLQEYIFNSSKDFFAEIGEDVFVIGQEITPSQTVKDRIDLLGLDAEGAAVIVELKRGSNKLQMLQAISYAGMVARWTAEDFQSLLTEDAWEDLVDFLDVDTEDINRRQRLLLVAEGYDYALLSGAEWLNEQYGIDIRCISVSLATDGDKNAEYIACSGVYPPPALADQAATRAGGNRPSRPARWSDWDEVISMIENEHLKEFTLDELRDGRENYLLKATLFFRLNGKRRWHLHCRRKHAYVWQQGRFENDVSFWQKRLSDSNSVEPKKRGRTLVFKLCIGEDFTAFKEVVSKGGMKWINVESNKGAEEEDAE